MLDQFFEEEEEASADEASSIAVGIDLGTTNTVVAHSDEQGLHVFTNESGRELQPSVVSFLPNGQVAVGQQAQRRRLIDPQNTIYSAKRIIGQPFSSPRLQRSIANLPYTVVEGENQEALIRTRAGDFSVPQISRHVVELARTIATKESGRETSHCVITVPANFNDAQREATRRAAKAAGLEVLRILNEPTAAALAYGHGRQLNERIAVFDMGGGTFDLSVLAVRRGLYEVLATGGDPFLGGDDMDHAVADAFAQEFLAAHHTDPRASFEGQAKLMIAAEQVKMQLSDKESVPVKISELAYGPGGVALSLDTTFTRAQFDELVHPIVERALECAAAVLHEADILPQHVDQVLLVGGATNVPMVRDRVSAFFGREAQGDINPMLVVALGAAAHAQTLFAPETIQRSQDQGTALNLDLDDAPLNLLLDVTSHPVGLATAGGYAEVLLAKNTQIPAEVTRVFSTARDDQDSVTLRVCQGEDRRFENNEFLGELRLAGLPKGPRGQVRIEVGFLINADGLLQVTAKDAATGVDAHATLSLFGLNEEEFLELADDELELVD